MEIIVSVNGCNVPNYVQSEGNAKFRVNFKPREAAPHNLSVRFNGEPVPGRGEIQNEITNFMECEYIVNMTFVCSFSGSPFTCKIFKPDQILANEDGLKTCHVGRTATIFIDSPSDSAVCKVVVTSPNGRQLPVDTNTRVDNRICAKFTPVEVGTVFFLPILYHFSEFLVLFFFWSYFYQRLLFQTWKFFIFRSSHNQRRN